MRDLANERDAVVRRLAALNVDAVNAESWSPSGAGSWARIQQEIESSDVFVLLLGERYGWIPSSGPGAERGLSVTHLEFEFAGERGLPILPFLKRLDFDAARDTPDARKREEFRSKVTEWDGGRFVTTFDLAADLADRVAHAVVGLLTDEYLRRTIAERLPRTALATTQLASEPANEKTARIPIDLVEAIRSGKAMLFAGSGMSLAAGMPSVAAFVEHFRTLLGRDGRGIASGAPATEFATAAADVEAILGQSRLKSEIEKLLVPPQGVSPTVAHQLALRLFNTIVTTNFDSLFEVAAAQQTEAQWQVVDGDGNLRLDQRTIVKLHGSISSATGFVITETDLALLDFAKPQLWTALAQLLATRTLVVVGSSLRDPSIVRLFRSIPGGVRGYAVLPQSDQANDLRLERWNLKVLHMTSEAFFRDLAAELLAQAG